VRIALTQRNPIIVNVTSGVPVEEFADAVMARLQAGDLEIPYGFSAQASRASREELDALFMRMNQAPA